MACRASQNTAHSWWLAADSRGNGRNLGIRAEARGLGLPRGSSAGGDVGCASIARHWSPAIDLRSWSCAGKSCEQGGREDDLGKHRGQCMLEM